MLLVEKLTTRTLTVTSLDVAAGSCIAVTGASGSGKSLLLRALADLDPCEGSVRLDGASCQDMPAPDWRRRVGYVGPEAGWWTDRVGDHFDDEAAAAELAGRFGLDPDCLTWPVTRLSTGERQRLALARAMVRGAKVLLLDEPTGALDPETTAEVESAIQEFLGAGGAVILITHAADQAERLADRHLRIEDGHLVEGGAS